MKTFLARFGAPINLAIFLGILLVCSPDHAVFVIFLTFAAGGSALVGRELARTIPSRIVIAVSVLILIGVAILYAGGIIKREAGFSEYLVYLAILWIGVFVPASAITETIRMQRKSFSSRR
ncbi:hypothetical protein KAH43_06075 [Candidatus Bipolaricaulota bacterium]|nr:hypothetical protein [Candidatus Bipolaricaulota bacterium]